MYCWTLSYKLFSTFPCSCSQLDSKQFSYSTFHASLDCIHTSFCPDELHSLVDRSSDVCLEAEVSPRGSKSDASASPRCFDASARPCLGLDVMTSASHRSRLFCLATTRGIGTFKLRYDIIIRWPDRTETIDTGISNFRRTNTPNIPAEKADPT